MGGGCGLGCGRGRVSLEDGPRRQMTGHCLTLRLYGSFSGLQRTAWKNAGADRDKEEPTITEIELVHALT